MLFRRGRWKRKKKYGITFFTFFKSASGVCWSEEEGEEGEEGRRVGEGRWDGGGVRRRGGGEIGWREGGKEGEEGGGEVGRGG